MLPAYANADWFYTNLILLVCVFLASCYGLILLFYTLSIFHANCKLHNLSKPSCMTDCPGVSVIKPLLGNDQLLESNLRSFFTLQYPGPLELLFCVEDDTDEAVKVVEALQAEFPHMQAKLLVGADPSVTNPMVRNMLKGYESAANELVWISSSRCRATDEMLLDLVGRTERPGIGLVHQLPWVCDKGGFASLVEKMLFSTSIPRAYLAFDVMHQHCFTGMSYMFKKIILDEFGGLAAYGQYLAEDFFISNAFHEKGYKNVVAGVPAQQNTGGCTLWGLNERLVRWQRLRLSMIPGVVLLEPLQESVIAGLLMSCMLNHYYNVSMPYFLAAHFSSWFLLDLILYRSIQHRAINRHPVKFIAAWLVLQVLPSLVFIQTMLNPFTITWGHATFKMSYGGKATRVPPKLRSHS